MENTKFYVKDCALATIATGIKAQNLSEFRDKLAVIHQGSIYYHFWRSLLHSTFEYRNYYNDFSYWAHYHLHDDFLAERLELVNPAEFASIEELRRGLLDIVDDRLDEQEMIPWARRGESFTFIRSKIVVFNTPYTLNVPHDMVNLISKLSRSSIFYHFIDARRRTPDSSDDFSNWLKSFGNEYENLITAFHQIDPYFIPLSDLQQKLLHSVTNFFLESLKENSGGATP